MRAYIDTSGGTTSLIGAGGYLFNEWQRRDPDDLAEVLKTRARCKRFAKKHRIEIVAKADMQEPPSEVPCETCRQRPGTPEPGTRQTYWVCPRCRQHVPTSKRTTTYKRDCRRIWAATREEVQAALDELRTAMRQACDTGADT